MYVNSSFPSRYMIFCNNLVIMDKDCRKIIFANLSEAAKVQKYASTTRGFPIMRLAEVGIYEMSIAIEGSMIYASYKDKRFLQKSLIFTDC